MPALACPRCAHPLDQGAELELSCTQCHVNFPLLGEPGWAVPMLWPEPAGALGDWRNRFNAALAEVEQQQEATGRSRDQLPAHTERRLSLLHGAYNRYQYELRVLLAPLQVGEALARETHLALQTRLPSHHGVLSYAANIHRDWSWGETENTMVCDHLLAALNKLPSEARRLESLLIMGCGAGRLAYDLQRQLGTEDSWALDSNPLLTLIGSRLSIGHQIELTEFPVAPISLEHSAVARTLNAPAPVEGLHFVCADALAPPFAAGGFDLVVTPWLLDVIDASVSEVISTIHRLLKPGGVWLQHGSVAFQGSEPDNRLSAEELAEITEMQGFAVVHREDIRMPYLQSPASRAHRQEQVYTQMAVRDQTRSDSAPGTHKHLPDWIAHADLPVPLTTAFRTQITTVRIHAFIMSLIDGKRTIDDMAEVLEKQRLMPADQAVHAIRGFLTTMHEEAVHEEGTARQS